MRVLGFDPGTATTGYGIVDKKGSKLEHVAHGCIRTPPGREFAERLKIIFEAALKLIEQYSPHGIAIEKLYFSKNVTTAISVAQARGVLALAAAQAGIPISEYSPLEIKMAVVGYGKATKKQVQQMIKILLALNSIPSPDDASDALALAICKLNDKNPIVMVSSSTTPLHPD